MEQSIEAIVKFVLHPIYSINLDVIHNLCHNWRLRLLFCGTNRSTALVAIEWKTFKKMFHFNPKPMILPVPKELQATIAAIEIIRIEVLVTENPPHRLS